MHWSNQSIMTIEIGETLFDKSILCEAFVNINEHTYTKHYLHSTIFGLWTLSNGVYIIEMTTIALILMSVWYVGFHAVFNQMKCAN